MISFVSIVGARPQFVKLAPVATAMAKTDSVSHTVIHTGQHYDVQMSEIIFQQLKLPEPDLNLEIGSASHGEQTAAMLSKIEAALESAKPSVVIVYGDTNSTLAGVVAAAKLNIKVAHVEAGLRSFDRSMPEEINRIVADHCADRLYAPTPTSMSNLSRENLADRAIQSGDVMLDAVLHNRDVARDLSRALDTLELNSGAYSLLTVHRAANTTPEVLKNILDAVASVASESRPVVFPVHPRTRNLLSATGHAGSESLRIVEPVGYLDMLRLIEEASVVLTDSGGVQKEAAFLETPCITLRDETEWSETVELGVNRLVGHDARVIRETFETFVQGDSPFDSDIRNELTRHYGSGDAAELIVGDLCHWSASGFGAN